MENMRIRRNVLKDLSEMTICQAYAAKSFIHSNGKFATSMQYTVLRVSMILLMA